MAIHDEKTLYRCYHCNKLLYDGELREDGTCPCGSRKNRLAFGITPEEMAEVIARGYQYDESRFAATKAEAWVEE